MHSHIRKSMILFPAVMLSVGRDPQLWVGPSQYNPESMIGCKLKAPDCGYVSTNDWWIYSRKRILSSLIAHGCLQTVQWIMNVSNAQRDIVDFSKYQPVRTKLLLRELFLSILTHNG